MNAEKVTSEFCVDHEVNFYRRFLCLHSLLCLASVGIEFVNGLYEVLSGYMQSDFISAGIVEGNK